MLHLTEQSPVGRLSSTIYAEPATLAFTSDRSLRTVMGLHVRPQPPHGKHGKCYQQRILTVPEGSSEYNIRQLFHQKQLAKREQSFVRCRLQEKDPICHTQPCSCGTEVAMSAYPCGKSDNEGFQHSCFSGHSDRMIGLPNYLPTADVHSPSNIANLDGACDEPDEDLATVIKRSCSLLPLHPQPARLSKVRFLSDENLRSRENSLLPNDAPSQQQINGFTNPFSEEGSIQSRRTSSSSDTAGYLRPNAFSGHRDTLARLPLSGTMHKCSGSIWATESTSDDSEFADEPYECYGFRGSGPIFPRRVIVLLLSYLSFEDYKNLRLVCRRWNSELPRPNFPALYRIPRELLQEIYSYLSPCDFDAARHTCRAWYLASLDAGIQKLMLQRNGCQDAFSADICCLKEDSFGYPRNYSETVRQTQTLGPSVFGKEWICSKRLATENRLSSQWQRTDSGSGDGISRLFLVKEVDFSAVLDQQSAEERHMFTASACGNFVLVLQNNDILVYRLWDTEQALKPIVRLIAGTQALEVSMDTSSERYAVAALLEGRIGMLWDISENTSDVRRGHEVGEPLNLGLQTDIQSSARAPTSQLLHGHVPVRSHEMHAGAANGYYVSPLSLLRGTSSPGFVPSPPFMWDEHFPGQSGTHSGSSTHGDSDEESATTGIPIQARPTAIYTDLGSPEDPPRSVAICPNRKCVAFGCRLGIELHWVNALTGGDLSRWFPLAAPSDYLYFLPQRPGIDSRKKLRLISSAAGPMTRHASKADASTSRLVNTPASAAYGRRQTLTRLFFGNLPFPTSATPVGSRSDPEMPTERDETQGVLRTVDCDHFRAVPISDGSHLLFTDPSSGLLCLGSDAPLGGPTKLVRKIMFMPPTTESVGPSVPLVYSAGKALEWGLRVVSFYANGELVLFNVPSDLFHQIQAEQTSFDAWDGSSTIGVDPAPATSPANATRSIFPGTISGASLAYVGQDFIDDLAVHTQGGGFSLWVFYRSGRAELYRIYSPGPARKILEHVEGDGLVYEDTYGTEEDSRQSDEGVVLDLQASSTTGHVKWAGRHT
ncbi:hypothetical protein ABEF92_002801 [Exophiala dermatitidis]|uniref:F-box domain-containing protein n=1 Tax=Exophiala dermatitidis (strain ATCC 34100 / CBS 525.76 / NIH/UT8656) TaxID=858893 RepID=H6BN48_EXODN|nr:uncharacterized protein HMPREF1120_00388 [Exophiala dermatitidis NIH/UT8656]EHY52172.1 hypothetical protein HMPREF1120_00388 [Exophiala dermatitidis NIH/UT8656]